jgi:diaminohydroxyphosphoribosylaminopyrimidine deaminase/5-amino-6-(5-phosphoribosylamino)uracil reductase
MALALSLGARGLGRVWPNPAVGCVIVQGGRIVGRGWTARGGRPHAETQALRQAGAAARGATVYVSLEPCAHHGQTPPCAGALIDAGVARVVTALADSDPRVAGQGHAMLRAAGIDLAEGVLQDAARRAHRGFLIRVAQGRPMVTLKLAASLDGRIATASGESRWITGSEARRRVHAQRLRHDAVLIGAGTARDDDPMLTVRDMGSVAQPVRVVAARTLDLPQTGRLARSAREVPLWLLYSARHTPAPRVQAWAALGARLLPVAARGRALDPVAMLRALGAAGLTRVLCEGGGSLAAALLEADLVDEVTAYGAGLALGAEARPALGALGIETLEQAARFRLRALDRVGADILSEWERLPSGRQP